MQSAVVQSAGCSVRRVLFPFALTLATTLAADQTTQQSPTFRAGVDVVHVDVSVLDKHRLPVAGLTAADFTVYEDGKARPIVAFTDVELPTRVRPPAPWMADIAPDVATNIFPSEGRLVVILFDRAINISQRAPAVEIAEAVVAQLRPGDLAAVVYSTLGIPQNFTSDAQRLRSAIRRPLALLADGDDGSPAECYCGACSLESIERVADAIKDVRQRRKVLFVIGSNIAIQSTNVCSGILTPLRTRVLRLLEAGNITVNAMDPSGLPTQATTASQTGVPPQRTATQNLVRQGNLRVLPDHTGGRATLGNRPDQAVAEIFRETNRYYVLGFQPAVAKADGRFHSIEVKVRRPDVTLQSRRGYFAFGSGAADGSAPSAANREPPAALPAPVTRTWPATGLGLSMQAVPFARDGLNDAALSVVLRVRQPLDPGVPPTATTATGQANVFVGAFDRNGRLLAQLTQQMSVTPGHAEPDVREYEVQAQLPLRPGRYELRAAVEDTALGAAGSVYTDVEVPSFANTPASISGILLHSAPPGAPVPAPPAAFLPIVPTARREFGPAEHVSAFARLHQGVTRALMPGYLVSEILDEHDTRVFRQELRLVPEQFGANRAMDYQLQLPLDRLPAGQYVLTIEVTHGNVKVRKDARFTVK